MTDDDGPIDVVLVGGPIGEGAAVHGTNQEPNCESCGDVELPAGCASCGQPGSVTMSDPLFEAAVSAGLDAWHAACRTGQTSLEAMRTVVGEVLAVYYGVGSPAAAGAVVSVGTQEDNDE